MKTFLEIREALRKGMPPGEHVFDTKVKGIEVMVHKEKGKFTTYIDREKLDTYPNLNIAKKAGMEYVKQVK
jgi:hypothetical protein